MCKLTQLQFESLVSGLVARIVNLCKKALSDPGVKPSEIDKVFLVGSMTPMPKVTVTVKGVFGREPSRGVNPDDAVAVGARVSSRSLFTPTMIPNRASTCSRVRT